MPTAPVHSSAARAVSTGQPRASSKASKRGASPARSTKCDSPSARSVKVRTTRVWGVAMREYTRGSGEGRRHRDEQVSDIIAWLCPGSPQPPASPLLRYQFRLRLDLHDP